MDEIRIEQVRETKKGRYALFTQEGFLFSVDSETLVKYNIGAGSLLSGPQLEMLLQQSDLRRCKDKALRLLSMRQYASQELYEKLLRDFVPQTAAAAVEQMHNLQLLDDAAFAEQRAQYLQRQKKSRRQIVYSLRQLGIQPQLIDQALASLPEEEDEVLDRLIRRQYASRLAAGKTQQVAAALMRRGFSGAKVRCALERFCEENQNEGLQEAWDW